MGLVFVPKAGESELLSTPCPLPKSRFHSDTGSLCFMLMSCGCMLLCLQLMFMGVVHVRRAAHVLKVAESWAKCDAGPMSSFLAPTEEASMHRQQSLASAGTPLQASLPYNTCLAHPTRPPTPNQCVVDCHRLVFGPQQQLQGSPGFV